MKILILVLGLFAAAAQAQQIYRWVDADGKVRYTSEKPPAGAAATTLQPRVSTVGGNASQPGAKATVATAKPAVKMYMTDWCPYCRKAGEYFRKNGIAYTELNIEKSGSAKAEYTALGGKGIPVILVGDRRMNGFSEESMAAMLKAAGY